MGLARAIAFQKSLRSSHWPVVLGLLGCEPSIGDKCDTSIDCSPTSDRICDTTQPGGYCTIHNCEDTTEDEADAPEGACPEDAACVIYTRTPSAICEDAEGDAAYQRTFCMLRCENDTDCRTEDGYHCINVADPSLGRWDAIVIDRRPADERASDGPIKVCTQPFDGAPVPVNRSTEVCTGSSRPSEGG
jgi:hypothetical protein